MEGSLVVTRSFMLMAGWLLAVVGGFALGMLFTRSFSPEGLAPEWFREGWRVVAVTLVFSVVLVVISQALAAL